MKRAAKPFRTSIARTLFGSFLLLVVPVLALGIGLNYIGMQATRREIERNDATSVNLLAEQIADRLSGMEQRATAILLDDELTRLANPGAGGFDLYDCVQFYNKVKLYSYTSYESFSLNVVLPRQGWVLSSERGMKHTEVCLALPRADSGRVAGLWAIHPDIWAGERERFSLAMGWTAEGQSGPYAVLEMDQGEILRSISEFFSGGNARAVFLLDRERRLYQSGDDAFFAEPSATAGIPMPFERAAWPYSTALDAGGVSYRAIFAPVGATGSLIGVAFGDSEILAPIALSIRLLALFLALSLAVCAVFVLLSYRRIVSPVATLAAAMKRVGEGDFAVRVREERHSDIADMLRQFNVMVERIDKSILAEYQMQRRLDRMQIRFLRAQINPHFLYNSLFSLYSFIESGDDETASKLALFLGQYYQQAAPLDAFEIPLEQEIRNISAYVDIHSLRFREDLRLESDLADGMGGLPVPVLSLQTLVENSITHGLRGRKRGRIRVTARKQGAAVALSVEDDGAGMDEAAILALAAKLENPTDSEDSRGLENVLLRFRSLYGDGASIRILPQREGSTIAIIFPAPGEARGGEVATGDVQSAARG
ncbi:MAG: histidine kinase [Clostridiales bacterium]|jgi:two-component system sensor histidine kinase YesM|nr:histidine kinase [Clostridiales bacterium]